MKTTTTPDLDLFRRCYGDVAGNPGGSRLLHFKMQARDADEATAMLEAIGRYNEFDAEQVAPRLRVMFANCYEVQIGREFSPVIYLMPRYPHGEELDLANDMLRFLREAGADEVGDAYRGVLPDGAEFTEAPVRIRAWWD